MLYLPKKMKYCSFNNSIIWLLTCYKCFYSKSELVLSSFRLRPQHFFERKSFKLNLQFISQPHPQFIASVYRKDIKVITWWLSPCRETSWYRPPYWARTFWAGRRGRPWRWGRGAPTGRRCCTRCRSWCPPQRPLSCRRPWTPGGSGDWSTSSSSSATRPAQSPREPEKREFCDLCHSQEDAWLSSWSIWSVR